MKPLYRFSVDGVPLDWLVSRASGVERVDGPFRFELVAQAHHAGAPTVSVPDLTTKRAELAWWLADGTERVEHAYVDEVRRVHRHFEIVLVPRVALLADTSDHRVFLDEDAVSIAKQVLGDHGIHLESRVQRALAKRAQCAQAFESDLSFVSRILAEEGIAWFIKDERFIVTDHAKGFEVTPGKLPVVDGASLLRDRSVHGVRLVRKVVTDRVSLRDHDFQNPQVDLHAEAASARKDLERYEFPGGFRDNGPGRTVAGIRLEEARARELVLEGVSNAGDLAAGHVVSLEGDHAGDWLLLDVRHEGRDGLAAGAEEHAYETRFTAVPAATPYRPERQPAPLLGGLQSATTSGPAGQELHTEAHARVRTLLRWDRRRKTDEHSSAWLRTLQPPTSGGFFLPRVGWEILAGFSGTSADAPFVLGRLYNGVVRPPSALPGHKVVSAFGTQTTPGGGGANLVQMSDGKGGEALSFNASKDWNERTENDRVTGIAAAETATVGGNRKLSVGQVHSLKVSGAQTHSVGGNRTVNVNANKSITAGGETVMIGGIRIHKIGGDSSTNCSGLTRIVGGAKTEAPIECHTRAVSGTETVLVGGAWNEASAHTSVKVGGVSTETIGGPKRVLAGSYSLGVTGLLTQEFGSRSVQAGGAHEEGFNGGASYSVSGAATMKGSAVIFSATAKLTIKASGITITITPGAVKIDGKFDGAVASVDEGSETYA